jgi:hypothetical protein
MDLRRSFINPRWSPSLSSRDAGPGIVTWDDVLANKPAWNVLAWFASLVVLADG